MKNNRKKLKTTETTEVKQVVDSQTAVTENVPEKAVLNPTVKKKRKVLQRDAKRYKPDYSVGLSREQVEERVTNGLTNNVKAQNSKSIPAIIIGNTFTFFNLLCALVIVAYVNAVRNAEVSCDGKNVYNPSAETLYLEHEQKQLLIAPGETVYL